MNSSHKKQKFNQGAKGSNQNVELLDCLKSLLGCFAVVCSHFLLCQDSRQGYGRAVPVLSPYRKPHMSPRLLPELKVRRRLEVALPHQREGLTLARNQDEPSHWHPALQATGPCFWVCYKATFSIGGTRGCNRKA